MKIVFFDGYCSLCNFWVDWVMRLDRTKSIQFASLQGQTAFERLKRSPGPDAPDTVLYLRDGQLFERSSAVLRILGDSGSPWRMARIFLGVPRAIRDAIYGIIAKHRYQWFGKRETCRIPTAEERERFLP